MTAPNSIDSNPRLHHSRPSTLLLFLLWLQTTLAILQGQAGPDFEQDIAPLLTIRCLECHQGSDPSGGLDLTTSEGIRSGGESGSVIGGSDGTQSLLLKRIEAGEMPPKKQGRSQRLPEQDIDLIRSWLTSGADWPNNRRLDYFERTTTTRAGRDWWSLQPIKRPQVPAVNETSHALNPIDAFIQKQLAKHGFQPAPPADKRTLVRRLYHDLLGLPATREQIESFVNDSDPRAWPKLVDHLLEQPQYGERWARYWLDLVRYADTSGYERDQEKPFSWKYRDWVVNAFNTDLPYNQFIQEQLAGDELPDRNKQSLIATGFLRLGTWNDEPNDQADYQYERLEDLVHTTSSAFLAMTVKCARCHAHKFDAISQEDYYRMATAFWAGPIPVGSKQHLGGPTAETLGHDDILGWTDLSATPPTLHRLKNGERKHPLNPVVPASLSFLPTLEKTFSPPPEGARTSHRRRQLADWLTHPRNPLPARVMVNRIWQHHFGKAIVRTPNNFGFLADPPTHPQLLDWLAAEFQARGTSIKTMHRLILSSTTWKQATLHPRQEELETLDPSNRWWWRSERRRLDAESLRDALLSSSGELDLRVGGPGFKPTISPEALEGLSRKAAAWEASPPQEQRRRSLYAYLKRGLLPPMLTTFDLSDPTLSCGQRDVTTVPTQALTLMNNAFVHARSQHLAGVIAETTPDEKQQIVMAWNRILRRPPGPGELNEARKHLDQQKTLFASAIEPATLSPSNERAQHPKPSPAFHFQATQAPYTSEQPQSSAGLSDPPRKQALITQDDPSARPVYDAKGFRGQPVLWFNGINQFLKINKPILESQFFTIICVASDRGDSGHRAILSNWNGQAGNATSSLFLGLTAERTIRVSDAAPAAGSISERESPFILTAVNGPTALSTFQNGSLLKTGASVPQRRLDTSWVIGQQGNINGEFWNGGIAEILVFDRELSPAERQSMEEELAVRYQIEITRQESPRLEPDVLALASLCHVLMNSNEFIYVD